MCQIVPPFADPDNGPKGSCFPFAFINEQDEAAQYIGKMLHIELSTEQGLKISSL